MPVEVKREPFDGPLKSAIENAVFETMPHSGVRGVEIFEGEDHDGDAVLFVEVSHDFTRTPIDPRMLSFLLTRLRDELARSGEKRFPIVRHRFADQQQVVGYT